MFAGDENELSAEKDGVLEIRIIIANILRTLQMKSSRSVSWIWTNGELQIVGFRVRASSSSYIHVGRKDEANIASFLCFPKQGGTARAVKHSFRDALHYAFLSDLTLSVEHPSDVAHGTDSMPSRRVKGVLV